MNKLKVALAQIDYRPAFILESHELLVEPIFSSIKEPHTSISLMDFKGSEKISGRLREKYISWLRVKIVAIIEKCIELSVDLIVFPEYSIPFQVLKDICLLTKGEKIRVVAGTHIVVKTEQQLPEGYPDPKKYLKCAMMPIIADGKVQYYTFKSILAAEENNNIRIPKDDISSSFSLDTYTLNAKICIEAVADQETLQMNENSILVIPSLSKNIEPFKALQILGRYKEIPIIYANGACYGGSVISGPYAIEGKHWFVDAETKTSKPIPKNCEALVTATIDLGAVRHSVGTVLLPSAITLNEVLPFLYKENKLDVQLMQLIDRCKEEESIAPLGENVNKNSAILREIVKKLQLDEKQGILDSDTLREGLNYVKINTFDFQQMTFSQVREAIVLFSNRTNDSLSDSHFIMTQGLLYEYLNKCNQTSETSDYDFSKDKGLFRGRDVEKNALSRFFDDPEQKLMCINGLWGIGKTKLVSSIESEILPSDTTWNIKQIQFKIGTGYDYIIEKLAYDLNLPYIQLSRKSVADIALQYEKQIEKLAPIIIIIDDFHYCLNSNGYFTDLRVKEFFKTLTQNIQSGNSIKMIFTSNRRMRDFGKDEIKLLDVSKLDDENIRSIVSYCYKKITKGTVSPQIGDNIIKSAYGNPFAAILITQLIVQKGTTDIEAYDEFKRYQEGLIKNIIEEIEFTSDEKELLRVVATSKGEVCMEFIEKYYSQVLYCIESLSDRLIIENNFGKLYVHPLFREVFYGEMPIQDRFELHKKYSQYFEKYYDEKKSRKDPAILSNLIYHLGGSVQLDKLSKYKRQFIDELQPVADQFYKDKDYLKALKYYLKIYDTVGKVRYDVLLKIAKCYLSGDNFDIKKSEYFFEQATKENPKGAFIWAEYSIALSNYHNLISKAIVRAKEAEEICQKNINPFPWERAKIKFAFAKAYRYQNFDKAMEFCKEACDLDETCVYYLCSYADMLLKSKNYEECKEYVKKAEKIQPRDKFLIRIKEKLALIEDEVQNSMGDGIEEFDSMKEFDDDIM